MTSKVKAAGGVVYKPSDQEEQPAEPLVLMIYRRQVWDLPKGKKEEDESRRQCATREVSEEVGSEVPVINGDLGTTYHEYTRDDTRYGKTTFWYAMQLDEESGFNPQQEEEIEKVEWVPLYKAKKRAEFDNLKKLLDRFEVWYWDHYKA